MTATPDIPLNQRESNVLEFKGAKALSELRSLARAVVAFLNADGGHLWIGLAEKDGVAANIESVSPLQREATRLQDGLSDLIEPPPLIGQEVEIVPIIMPGGNDSGLLKVTVKPGHRGPYAFLEGALRGYVVRSGSRTRPLTRDELRSRFAEEARPDLRDQISKALLEEQIQTAQSGFRGLQLLVQPALSRKLDLSLERPVLEPMLQDASTTGNRPLGWVFASPNGTLEAIQGGVRLGRQALPDRLTIQRDGSIRYREPLDRLWWKGGPNEIWPLALLEFPTSVLRLASRLYSQANESTNSESPIVSGLALFGIKGWLLRPYSPRILRYQTSKAEPHAEDMIIPEPVIFSWKDLIELPDRCAFRLIARIYEAFGHFEDAIPSEFSRETGQLLIPS